MAPIRFNNQVFLRKVETTLSPTVRQGLVKISKMKANGGIRGQGELAKIMGVLNFGDPGHSVLNTKQKSQFRKKVMKALASMPAEFVNPSGIPARPWLSRITAGSNAVKIANYINANMPKLMASIPKRGQGQFRATSSRAINPNDFMQGLSDLLAELAQNSWASGTFVKNAPSTLKKKSPVTKPLHGKSGNMSRDKITGWVE